MKVRMNQMMPDVMMHNPNENAPIWVNEFGEDATKQFCNALFAASEQDSQKPIVVYINSPGGDASGLLAMFSAMDAIPNKIVTVAMGYAMSAGCLLLAHGDVRFASPYSRIMVHKVQAGAFGNVDDIANETEEIVNLNKTILGVFAKDTKKTLEEVETSIAVKRELYMNAEEAKAYGIVDMVGVPRVETASELKYVVAVSAPVSEPKIETAVAPKPKAKVKKAKKKKK